MAMNRLVGLWGAATAALLSSTLAGCGDDELSASEAVQTALEDSCAMAHECRSSFPTDSGFEFGDFYGESVSECVQIISAFFDSDAIEASIAAGRIVYDADDADACLDFQRGITCDQFWGTDPVDDPVECESAFQGTVADGDSCTIDDDCADVDSFCDDEETMTCVPEPAATRRGLLGPHY